MQTFKVPARKFQYIHVDLVGPLSLSHGYTYIFTIVDRFLRWVEAFPLTESTAQACGEALIHGWVARFGVPGDISSDRGAQFTSDLWAAMANCLGTTLHHTTAYNPQSNGLVERFHRNLKEAFRARGGFTRLFLCPTLGPPWDQDSTQGGPRLFKCRDALWHALSGPSGSYSFLQPGTKRQSRH